MTFIKHPKVSYACRALISRILVPQRSRARIEAIKQDPWLIIPTTSVHTSVSNEKIVDSVKNDQQVLIEHERVLSDDKMSS